MAEAWRGGEKAVYTDVRPNIAHATPYSLMDNDIGKTFSNREVIMSTSIALAGSVSFMLGFAASFVLTRVAGF